MHKQHTWITWELCEVSGTGTTLHGIGGGTSANSCGVLLITVIEGDPLSRQYQLHDRFQPLVIKLTF